MSRTAKSKKQRLREKRRRQSSDVSASTRPRASAGCTHGQGRAPEPLQVDEGRTWHLVRTAPCQMDRALKELKERGIPTVVPRTAALRYREGRPYLVHPALFRRTVFVGVEAAADLADKVLATRGVTRVLRNPSRADMAPMTITGPEMAGFVVRIGITEEREPAGIAIGEEIVMIAGPFASFPGRVEEVLPGERLKVSVTLFGRETPFECDLDDVRSAR